ncbi:hypothetical protein ACFVMC_14745 [Nocardia sp. NPDC127579]|uniref:hypothetical protein n=1 Tax=Nocardia sp. NPDC127579 TaxID=3345402 RepID=UPI00362E674A
MGDSMGLLFAGIAAALWESSKSGPPDVGRDESPDATQARNRILELAGGSGLQFQGSKVPESAYTNPENLDDLYERVQAMDPAAVKLLNDRWEAMRNKLNDGFVDFGLEMTRAIEAKWQGEAANSAATGIAEYVKKSSMLVDSVALVAEKVKLVKSAIEITKPNVQQAPESTVTSNIASWVPGPTWKLNEHRDESYRAAAANVVKNVFYPAIKEADEKVPLVPTPYNPVQAEPSPAEPPVVPSNSDGPEVALRPEAAPVPEGTGDPSSRPASSGASTAPSLSEVPKSIDPKLNSAAPGSNVLGAGMPGSSVSGSGVPGTTGPRAGALGPNVPGAGVAGSSVPRSGAPGSVVPRSGVPGSVVPRSGVPGSVVPRSGVPGAVAPRSGVPGSVVPRPGVPGSGVPGAVVPRSGAPGSAVPRSGVPGSGAPGSGAPVAANPGTGRPGSGAAGGASAAAHHAAAGARPGVAGMPGMGVPGSRGQGDDDREHRTKDYLITQKNGELLTGLDPEHRVKTVPPVIGE